MDVFEALGLDVPTRSMSVTEGVDAELLQFLAPVFGWDEKEASANSLILFPGESQQDVGARALVEVPSVNGRRQGDQSAEGAEAAKPDVGLKPSPFSGVTQFDLFLGDVSTAPLPAASPAAADGEAGVGAAGAGAFPPAAADPASTAMVSPFSQPVGRESQLHSKFSQGLLDLLEDTSQPAPPPPPPTQQAALQQQQQQAALQQQQAALQQQGLEPAPAALPLPSMPQQPVMHPLAALPQQQAGVVMDMGPPAGMSAPPLVPPPLPQLPLQAPAAHQLQQVQHLSQHQQQHMGVLSGLQSQSVFQQIPLPMLGQPQQHPGQQGPVPLRLPQLGQPVPLPVLQLSQQLLQQRQAAQQQQQHQQQQQQVFMSDFQLPDADGSGGDNEPRLHSQPKRRGRPPKVAGQYSKGYEAIKRYREKKKGMVEHMEAEIAMKREELHKLQAEQEALRSHQLALESTMSNQDKLLAQMLQLKMSLAGREDHCSGDLEVTTAAAIAGVRQALAMQNGSDTAAAQAVTAAAAAERHQRLLLRKQLAQKKVLDEAPVFLRRYQGYVQDVADRLTRAAGSAEAAAAAAAGFPTFPFTLVETLSLWQLSRLAIMTRTDISKQSGGGGGNSSEPWDDFTLNLSSGQHDLVPQEFWKGVAGQIGLQPEQLQQLLAAWRLYVSAMNRLNEERQGLLLKLQEAAAAEEEVVTGQQQQQPDAGVPGGAAVGGAAKAEPSTSGFGAAAAAAAGQPGQHTAAGGFSARAVLPPQGSAAPINRRTGTAALDVAFVYLDLLDAVERNLLRGRAIIMMFGWSMLCMLSAEQIGRVCVASWPYFPLMRAIVGYMLGKEDLVP